MDIIEFLMASSIGNMFYICYLTECIERMVMNVNTKRDICPTLSAIVEQLDGYSLQERQYQSSQDFVCDVHANEDITGDMNGGSEFMSVNDAGDDKGCELDEGSYDNAEAWSFDHNDDAYQADDNFNTNNPDLENQYEVFLTCSIAFASFFEKNQISHWFLLL